MKLSSVLYFIAAAAFSAGVVVEIQEIKEAHEVWVKAGANGSPAEETKQEVKSDT